MHVLYRVSFRMSCFCCFFFFKQKTAYEMRISDWSSDVCSSDLQAADGVALGEGDQGAKADLLQRRGEEHSAIEAGGNAVVQHLARRADLLSVALEARRWLRIELGRASCGESVCQYV